MTVETDLVIEFEGLTPAAEFLGSTQANFSVDRPGIHAKELSVLLNNPAAARVAELAGRENTPEFREQAARVVGEAWISHLLSEGHRPESIVFVSKATLDENPAFAASLAALFS